MATTNLQTIQIKVRRITRSPSEAQLTTPDLNQYINTFVLYDFPESIRTFNYHTTFTFYTNPYQDRYPTDMNSFAGAVNNPLYDFQNHYLTLDSPFFIAGYNSLFSQSREEFYGIYPLLNSIAQIPNGVGNGTTSMFTGVINSSQATILPGTVQQQVGLLQRNVLFSSAGVNGVGLTLVDLPIVDTVTGNNTLLGNLYDPNSALYQEALITPPTLANLNPTNNVNYSTGQFTITFTSAPGAGQMIYSQTVPQVLSLPQSVLFYDNTFYVRPVPDEPYAINFQCRQRPTELLSTSQNPDLNELWQYIAYGASKKIFEDRMDIESVQVIMPEFNKQERLCLRRTLVQNSTQRASTIYEQQTGITQGWSFNQNNGIF